MEFTWNSMEYLVNFRGIPWIIYVIYFEFDRIFIQIPLNTMEYLGDFRRIRCNINGISVKF